MSIPKTDGLTTDILKCLITKNQSPLAFPGEVSQNTNARLLIFSNIVNIVSKYVNALKPCFCV